MEVFLRSAWGLGYADIHLCVHHSSQGAQEKATNINECLGTFQISLTLPTTWQRRGCIHFTDGKLPLGELEEAASIQPNPITSKWDLDSNLSTTNVT